MGAVPACGAADGSEASAGRGPAPGGGPRDLGRDHLRGHLGLHVAAVAADVRAVLADGLPALRPVEPGQGLGPAPPGHPRRTRRPRRGGLVAMCDRLGQCPGGKRGPLTGPNPTDRGKSGSKIHLITDRNGLPLSLGISGANVHDSHGLEPLVRGIPPIRSRRGPRRRRPAKLHADKGYDYDHLRRWLRKRGSAIASPAGASSPPHGWAYIAGWSRGPRPGWLAAVDSTAATNARPNTSSPSSA
ncbi:transposase family protein [Streptomyces noursei ATCC 11455]|nr:transposase family protein [Streptomyces noursei ATCC 11455]